MATDASCASDTLGICNYLDGHFRRVNETGRIRHRSCEWDADPDVAGIGVLLSFVISMVMTYLLTVYGFYFVEDAYSADRLSNLDHAIIDFANRLLSNIPGRGALLTQGSFRDVVLIFSDQQLVTGLAIVLVAYGKLATITEYHFAIASNLANMSFVVHISTVYIIGQELKLNPPAMYWRVLFIVLLSLLTLITTVPWGNKFYLESYGTPMICIWENSAGNYPAGQAVNMVVYMLLQLWGIINILAEFFPAMFDNPVIGAIIYATVWVFRIPRRFYSFTKRHLVECESSHTTIAGAQPSLSILFWRVAKLAADFAALTTFILTEIMASQALELIRNFTFLFINTKEVFEFRSEAPRLGRQGDENEWGFGQAVPIILVLLPLFALLELLYKDHTEQKAVGKKRKIDEQVANGKPYVRRRQLGQSFARNRHGPASTGDLPLPNQGNMANNSSDPSKTSLTQVVPAQGTPQHQVWTPPRTFYFGYEDEQSLGPYAFEARLYDDTWWFKALLRMLMIGLCVGLTVTAFYGWAL